MTTLVSASHHTNHLSTPAELRDRYLVHVCWYCQGVGYLERIPVKRRGRILIGPSRVKCLVCDGYGHSQATDEEQTS